MHRMAETNRAFAHFQILNKAKRKTMAQSCRSIIKSIQKEISVSWRISMPENNDFKRHIGLPPV